MRSDVWERKGKGPSFESRTVPDMRTGRSYTQTVRDALEGTREKERGNQEKPSESGWHSGGLKENEKKERENRRLTQEERKRMIGLFWSCSLRLADESERQQEKWRDLVTVSSARQQSCNVKRMNEFAGLMIEAREAQMEAMLLARRRSEERRGGGNENKTLMEEKMAAYERVRTVGQEALREATAWIEETSSLF